jgi:anaerobic sulfite reductase subunit B
MSYAPKPYLLSEIKPYTDDVRLFKIKSDLNPQPGQFLEISIPGVGECPIASCSCDKNYLDLLTRNAGNVTSAIFQLKKNDKLFIRGPYGKGFPVKDFKNKNIILFAGGTGIAPVTSLIDYVEKNKKDFNKVYIYFGFRDFEHILLKDRIEKWKKKFNFVLTLDKKPENNFKCETGFMQDLLEKHKPDLKNSVAVLCGPEIMMKLITDKLILMGMKESEIYWSMERRMECGFGSCGRCQIQDVYVCKDGPVFRYDIIKPKLENENASNAVKDGE